MWRPFNICAMGVYRAKLYYFLPQSWGGRAKWITDESGPHIARKVGNEKRVMNRGGVNKKTAENNEQAKWSENVSRDVRRVIKNERIWKEKGDDDDFSLKEEAAAADKNATVMQDRCRQDSKDRWFKKFSLKPLWKGWLVGVRRDGEEAGVPPKPRHPLTLMRENKNDALLWQNPLFWCQITGGVARECAWLPSVDPNQTCFRWRRGSYRVEGGRLQVSLQQQCQTHFHKDPKCSWEPVVSECIDKTH